MPAESSAPSLRIIHMASPPHAGGALVLRSLAAHPQVHVVFEPRGTDREPQRRLAALLRVWPLDRLSRGQLDRVLAPGAVGPEKTVLLLEQSRFQPRHRPLGFGLVRNPYASFCSLWSWDANRAGATPTPALNRRNWERVRLPRLMVWADATLPELLPALQAERDPARQFLLFWRARLRQLLAQQPTIVRHEDFVLAAPAALGRICEAISLPIFAAPPIGAAPAWSPSPLVDIGPFAEAVDDGESDLYRGLYGTPPAAPSDLAAAEAAHRAMEALHARLGRAQGRLRSLQPGLATAWAETQAQFEADPLAFAAELAHLRKVDVPAWERSCAVVAALGLVDPDRLDARSAPLALATMQLEPARTDHLRLFCGLLCELPARMLAKLVRCPALARNAEVVDALLQRLLDGAPGLALTPAGWYHLLIVGSVALAPGRFDALLRHLRGAAPAGAPAPAIAWRFRLPGDPPAAGHPPARERPLRVALCISGQLRGWRQAVPSWHRHLGLEGHEVDLCVHTWKQVGRRIPDPANPPSIGRVFADPAFCEAYRDTAQQLTLPGMRAAYPGLFAGLASGAEVDAAAVRAVYGEAATVVVDDEQEPRFQGWSNQQKMHYKIQAAHRLAESSGRPYDLMIRLRPDLSLAGRRAATDWHALLAASRARRVLFCELGPELREDLAMADQFAAGAPEVMADYAAAWETAPRAWAEGRPDVPRAFMGHWTLAYTCLWQGVRSEALHGLEFGPLLDERRLDAREIRALLAPDIASRPATDADRRLLRALEAC